jgi:hypothetical protein
MIEITEILEKNLLIFFDEIFLKVPENYENFDIFSKLKYS